MLIHLLELHVSTKVLEALPGKLDIKNTHTEFSITQNEQVCIYRTGIDECSE